MHDIDTKQSQISLILSYFEFRNSKRIARLIIFECSKTKLCFMKQKKTLSYIIEMFRRVTHSFHYEGGVIIKYGCAKENNQTLLSVSHYLKKALVMSNLGFRKIRCTHSSFKRGWSQCCSLNMRHNSC